MYEVKLKTIVSIYDYLLSLPMDYKHDHPIYELLAPLEDELHMKVNVATEVSIDDLAILISKNWLLNFEDEKFAWSIYMLYIKKYSKDIDAYRKISYFLMLYGWKLKHEILEMFIDEDYDFNTMYIYCINLQLYNQNGIHEMGEKEMSEYLGRICKSKICHNE